MPVMEIGLASRSDKIKAGELDRLIVVLNEQLRRDVEPIWNVAARVGRLDDPDRVPHGVSPLIVADHIEGTMKGVHAMQDGVAFAIVLATPVWRFSVSHELVEMVVDPSGEATRPGRALRIVDGIIEDAPGTVDYVLEVCDPVEDESHGYEIDGVTVSDFYTPRYFDDGAAHGVPYCRSGRLTKPRQVAKNGYLSWREQGGVLRQLRCFGKPEIVTLGQAPPSKLVNGGQHRSHLRGFIDSKTPS